jgi:uracil-DNA glycosylase
VIGRSFDCTIAKGQTAAVIPLPHPSGASTWHRMEPGKTLARGALGMIARHPAMVSLL